MPKDTVLNNTADLAWSIWDYMRSQKWHRLTKSILYSIWSTSRLSLSLHLPDAFLSCVHLILSFLWTSAFIRIVLTTRCLLKVRATPERVKESFHSPIVEFFKRISYYFPPAHCNLRYSPFFPLVWLLSAFTELYMGWSGAFYCTYTVYIYKIHICD